MIYFYDLHTMILIGYSGHSFVIKGIFDSMGKEVTGYCDKGEKEYDPFSLPYLGTELSAPALAALGRDGFFISVGNNRLRYTIHQSLAAKKLYPVNAIHTSAIIDPRVKIAEQGVMISAGVIINSLSSIGTGAICNTGSVIEHECLVGDFSHIAPGAILCGNVKVGDMSLVGAGSVIRENISIGRNAIIGAGSVVVKDVPDNVMVMGNPARVISSLPPA